MPPFPNLHDRPHSSDPSSVELTALAWRICEMTRQTGPLHEYVKIHVAALAFRDPSMSREYWRGKFIAGLHPDLAQVARESRDTTNQELVSTLTEFVARTNWKFRPVPKGGPMIMSARQPAADHTLLS